MCTKTNCCVGNTYVADTDDERSKSRKDSTLPMGKELDKTLLGSVLSTKASQIDINRILHDFLSKILANLASN